MKGGQEKTLWPDFRAGQRLFFLLGTDTARLAAARRELLHRLLKPEERDQNLVEVAPAASRMLSLNQVAGQIVDELATPAFFPDQQRVVYVAGIQELYGSKGASRKKAGKKKPAAEPKAASAKGAGGGGGEARLVAFLERDFATTSRNVLVVEAIENEDKRRKVDDKASALVAHLLRHATVARFYEPPLRYAFEDALLRRDAAGAVAAYREWINADTRFAVLGVLTDATRCLVQASLAETLRRGGAARLRGRSVGDLLPGGWRNLAGKHPRAREKYEAAAARQYRNLPHLIDCLERLPELSDAFYPPRDAVFVRDLDAAVEAYILSLCS